MEVHMPMPIKQQPKDALLSRDEAANFLGVRPQYSSLNYSNSFCDVDQLERFGVTRSQRELAHLALDAARIAPTVAGDDALLQNLLQHAVMKLFSQPRGE